MDTTGVSKIADRIVTLVEILERTAPFETFADNVRALVRKLETEGIRELVMLQFYAEPDTIECGVLLTFSDPGRMMEHIRLISSWDEFATFLGNVTPRDIRVYGTLNPEAEEWIRAFDVIRKRFTQHLAGFVR